MRPIPAFLAALVLPLGWNPLPAQVLTKATVGLALAKKIAAGAEAEALKHQWTEVIAVVDDGGNLVYLERMDGAQLGSLDVALAKAKTALYFKRPTKAYEDGVAHGRNTLLSVPNIIAIEGGVPLAVDGRIIGAIGVSGSQPPQDGLVAQAGVAALQRP